MRMQIKKNICIYKYFVHCKLELGQLLHLGLAVTGEKCQDRIDADLLCKHELVLCLVEQLDLVAHVFLGLVC